MAEHINRPKRAEPWRAFSDRIARGDFTIFEKARALSLALEDEWADYVKGKTDPRGHFMVSARQGRLVVRCLTATACGMPRMQFLRSESRFGGVSLEVKEGKQG